MLAISLEKEIKVASRALLVYLIISALLREVFTMSVLKFLYTFSKVSPLFLSNSPMTILSGFIKSSIATPSLKNSGFIHTPKVIPAFFFEYFSKRGNTTFNVVSGATVLFTTTRWYSFLLAKAFPICSETFLI